MGRYGLRRGSLGAVALWSMAVGALSPMVVVSGGLVATFAATGVVGVPLATAPNLLCGHAWTLARAQAEEVVTTVRPITTDRVQRHPQLRCRVAG